MAFYTEELIAKARELDLISYLKLYDPGELIYQGPNSYVMRSHGSLKLSNGKWMWWAKGIGGISALDYLVKVEGISFTDAVGKILTLEKISLPESRMEKERVPLVLPEPCKNNNRVVDYLFQRGIDMEIIYDCIGRGLLYEAIPYHNAIFVGFNENGEPAYAAYRSTKPNRILGEIKGSEKSWSFRFAGENSEILHVFESAIDLLSYLSLKKLEHGTWRTLSCLSLGGIAISREKKLPPALENYLKQNSEVSDVYLHLDNDAAGRRAAVQISRILENKYNVVLEYPAFGKDVNDELQKRKENGREV